MADEQTPTITVRLNVLGPLTIECEPGDIISLPSSKRACHLLALFAIEPTYAKQQLVNYLWSPGQDINDPVEIERVRIRGKLEKELSNARGVLGLDDNSGFLGSSGHLVVHRTTNNAIEVISDLDEFRKLASESRPPTDWQRALALVRGEVAKTLPSGAQMDLSWLDRERRRQRRAIRVILSRLHPDATDTELDELCDDVLDRRYELPVPVSAKAIIGAAPQVLPLDLRAGIETSRLRAVTEHLPSGRRLALLLAVAVPIVAGVLVWTLRPSKTPYENPHIVPPEGAAVNVVNGAVSLDALKKAPRVPLELAYGPMISACIFSAGPCHYAEKLSVHAGETIQFRIDLVPWQQQYPYLELHAVYVGPPKFRIRPRIHEAEFLNNKEYDNLTVSMFTNWPDVPSGYESSSIQLNLPDRQPYVLEYIGGSTTLLSQNDRLLHDLPNGILAHSISKHAGLALQDVGLPQGCSHCAQQYTRYIDFRAKVEITKRLLPS